jgi:hypothetical protein
MNTIETVEQCYEAFAREILHFANAKLRPWEQAVGIYGIFNTMVSSEWYVLSGGIKDEKGEAPPSDLSLLASDAVHFLRDNFLKTTGDRIWGLTFTLLPTGKFNIQYDYNKPEDYEETDDTVG